MEIYTKKQALKVYLSKIKTQNKSIGFVPTMGALHKGHISLIQKAKKNNAIVVASIFVNPTQFNNKEDLEKYPKTLDKDIELLKKAKCDVLFYPSVEEIYSNSVKSESYDFDGLEYEMEGKFRHGHFNGVGTVVKTLFDIVKPNEAYFGEKDFQQLQIIKKLVKKEHLDVSIQSCEIYREDDGLAMSSRNARLTIEHRNAAPFIYKVLKEVKQKFKTEKISVINNWVTNEFKNHTNLDLEYFTIADEKTLKTAEVKENDKKYRAFIAVFAGKIRLIDNIKLKLS